MTPRQKRQRSFLQDMAKRDPVQLRAGIALSRADGVDLDGAWERTLTAALHEAAWMDWIEGAAILVAKGVHPDSADSFGRSAFLLAVEAGRLDMAAFLASHGADPNLPTIKGHFALERAMHPDLRDTPMIELLLALPGIDRDQRGSEGFTVLSRAASKGHALLVGRLLAGGCDPLAANENGTQPIEYALLEGNADSARQILAHCRDHLIPFDLNGHYASGSNLLCSTILRQRSDALIATLLEFGARLPDPLPPLFKDCHTTGVTYPGLTMAIEWTAAHELRSELRASTRQEALETMPRRASL